MRRLTAIHASDSSHSEMFRPEKARRRPSTRTNVFLPLMPVFIDDDGANGTECRLTPAHYVHDIGDCVLKALRDPNALRLIEIEMQRRGARITATAAPVNRPPRNEKTGMTV
jgi:hypothetical protein